MVDPKLFAGPRLRRIRMRLGHTQTAMAGTLDISPSYLNLLERNQRPVTAQLIIKLAEVHEVDPREVKGETVVGRCDADGGFARRRRIHSSSR